MKKSTVLILCLATAFVVGGCGSAEPEAKLPNAPNFAADREKIQNDPTMSPVAKESALKNIDRMEAQAKK
ncbi:hypothetical protein EON81_15275 [bacterium]|nr:MAG: hypothetical protein EON81_15275 [bacterium]